MVSAGEVGTDYEPSLGIHVSCLQKRLEFALCLFLWYAVVRMSCVVNEPRFPVGLVGCSHGADAVGDAICGYVYWLDRAMFDVTLNCLPRPLLVFGERRWVAVPKELLRLGLEGDDVTLFD